MPLVNPAGLYSEGKVNLNPLPFEEMAMQAQQRRAARNDAIDKYYQNLPNTINDKGVRDQEIEGLNDKKNDIYQFGLQNRAALQNPKIDNGASSLQLEKMFRDAQGFAQESKNRANTAVKLAQLRGNPKYDYIFKDPDLISKIDAHEKPVGAEGSQAINFDQLTMPPAPFDSNKYMQNFKDIKPNYTTTTAPNPNDKFTQIKTETPVLGDQQKQAIYQRATENLIDNPSFEASIKKAMDSDPTLIGQIQKTFKENYGRDINPVTADHDIAAGFTLLGMGNAGIKTTTIPNEGARMSQSLANQKEMARIHFGYQQSLQKSAEKIKSDDKIQQDKNVDNFIDDQIKNSTPMVQDFETYGNVKATDASADPVIKGIFAKKQVDPTTGTSHTIYPEKVVFLDGGNQVRLVGEGFGETFSREQYKADLVNKMFNTPGKRTQLQGPLITPPATPASSSVKTTSSTADHSGFSRADLKTAGWNDKQIDTAVKAGKIKLTD